MTLLCPERTSDPAGPHTTGLPRRLYAKSEHRQESATFIHRTTETRHRQRHLCRAVTRAWLCPHGASHTRSPLPCLLRHGRLSALHRRHHPSSYLGSRGSRATVPWASASVFKNARVPPSPDILLLSRGGWQGHPRTELEARVAGAQGVSGAGFWAQRASPWLRCSGNVS